MSDYPDLETMTRELWDIEQIKRVKRRNLRCLDMKLWDEMGETFHPDVTTSWVNGDLVNHGTKCTATKGQIALQAEGSEVEFRKLILTPITKLTD